VALDGVFIYGFRLSEGARSVLVSKAEQQMIFQLIQLLLSVCEVYGFKPVFFRPGDDHSQPVLVL
jgi:hypothetical protein